MAFSGLLGNDALKYRVSGMLKNRKISHCYAVTGPESSGKHTFAMRFCAAMECTAGHEEPCMKCAQCRKVLEQTHPDVIYVDDTEHKQLPVKLVREIIEDAFVRPNEGARKIYVFEHAEKLSQQGQNALLKMLEEPPSYATFLLLIPNASLLLPTIRSRSVELPLSPVAPELLLPELRRRKPGLADEAYRAAAETGFMGTALNALEQPAGNADTERFARPFAARDAIALLELFTGMEKMNREQLAQQLELWRVFLAGVLCARFGGTTPNTLQQAVISGRSSRDISEAVTALSDGIVSCNANVSPAAVCAALAVKLS